MMHGIIPHAIAILAFLLVNIFFYSPIIFENKSINQNDILQGAGANQETIEFRNQTGEEALWTNSMFSGMPTYLINTYWSGDKSPMIYRIIGLGLPSPVNRTFIAMLSFYLLLVVFGVNPYLSIAGGISYGLNSFFMIGVEAGHIWKVDAIGLMPLVLAGIELTFRKKYIWGFLLTAVSMALQIKANHYQITYYLLIVVVIYGLFKLWQAYKEGALAEYFKIIGILIMAVILGVGVNFGKLWSAYEYGKYSIRGPSELTSNTQSTSGGLDRDYAFAWSNGIWEPMTFLVPNFFGGASQESLTTDSDLAKGLRQQGVGTAQIANFVKSVPTYWGDQPFTSGPYYMGAIIIFLFFLGVIALDGAYKWWLVSASVLGIMLSWGNNFPALNYLIFDYLPGYNKFRAVSNIVSIPFLCMPLLGFLGLQKLLEKEPPNSKKSLLTAIATVEGLLLILIVGAGMLGFRGAVDNQLSNTPWLIDLIRSQRESMLRTDALRSLFYILACGTVIYLTMRKHIPILGTYAIIGAMIFLDLFLVSDRYLNDENYVRNLRQTYFSATPADNEIKKDSDEHYRVLNLNNPFNEAKTSYFHSSIGGYHGAKMRRYQDLIEYQLQAELGELIQSLQNGRPDLSNLGAINMLNTKYIKFGEAADQVILNNSANGNAWFITNIKEVNGATEEIDAISNIDTKTQAVIDKTRFEVPTENLSDGSISLDDYKPNYLKYSTVNSGLGLAVFSEIYYPAGWNAYIDDNLVDILRVNYVLRALIVPAGNHKVEFRFEPQSYYLGNTIMLVSSIILIVMIIVGIGYEVRSIA